jgi:hypothetical protein
MRADFGDAGGEEEEPEKTPDDDDGGPVHGSVSEEGIGLGFSTFSSCLIS